MITTIGTRPDGTKFRADPQRMHEYINCRMETREPTPEEIEELRIPEAIVSIAIPEQVFLSEPIQKLIGGFRMIYSGLDIRTYEGYTHIGNIDLADIRRFITKETYEQLKSLGTIRPKEVIALFTTKENEEPTPESDTTNSSDPTSDSDTTDMNTTDTSGDTTESDSEEESAT